MLEVAERPGSLSLSTLRAHARAVCPRVPAGTSVGHPDPGSSAGLADGERDPIVHRPVRDGIRDHMPSPPGPLPGLLSGNDGSVPA